MKVLLAGGADPNLERKWLDQVQRTDGKDTPDADPRGGHYVSSVVCVACKSTPLHDALRAHSLVSVKLLIAYGANTDYQSTEGKPSLPANVFFLTFSEGKRSFTTLSLCPDETFVKALRFKFDPADWGWYPQLWKGLFAPFPVRHHILTPLDIIHTFCLCHHHCDWKLPRDVQFIIFTYICLLNRPTPLPVLNEPKSGYGWL